MSYRLLFNLATNIIALIGFVVLFLVALISRVEKRGNKWFIFALLGAVISCATNVVWYAIRAGSTSAVFLKSWGAFVFIAFLSAAFITMFYCLSYLRLKRKHFKIIGITFGAVFLIFFVLMIVNVFNDMFFTFAKYNEEMRIVKTDIAFIPYIFCWLEYGFLLVMFSIDKKLKIGERLAFIAFVLVPFVALIFHVIFPELSISTFAIIGAFLFHFMFFYVQRGITIQKQEAELSEQQIKLMLSQIQPHFIYNCLSSISYLIEKDPHVASEAINDFSDYLRVNFSNISQNKIVPFNKELEHTHKYLKLEKVRFEDRINIQYDIRIDNFNIPSLTLQPMVENAVKHGICKKPEGGTVLVKTSETDKEYLVEVIDDGVGFEVNKDPEDGRVHVGIKNVSDRLARMVNGELEINSEINKGTHVVIHIPKEGK